MEKTSIIILFFTAFLISAAALYFLTQRNNMNAAKEIAPKEEGMSPGDELLGVKKAGGVRNYTIEGEKVYEITGWIKSIDERSKQMVLETVEHEKTTYFDDTVLVRRIYRNDKGKIVQEPTSLSDLKPGATRITSLCTDDMCNFVKTITVIETRSL